MDNTTFSLEVFANKNSTIFERVRQKIGKEIDKNIGIVYDDYDAKNEIINDMKNKHSNIEILFNAPRKITLTMDDKVYMGKKMLNSKYVPKHYFNFKDIPETDDNTLFYVKKRGSTSAKGVNIVKYKDIEDIFTKNCIIQSNNFSPDLFDNKRYKLRVYVVLFREEVYIHKKAFGIISPIDYCENTDNLTQEELNKMNIIHQCPGIKWIDINEITKKDIIFNNLVNSCIDFKNIYADEINKISSDQFSILGIDYVTDQDGSVYIIEINHRPNFKHVKHITDNIDIPFLEDTFRLLINKSIDNTDFKLVN